MVIVEKRKIADIPALHIVKNHLKDEIAPLILFVHGFGSAKEHNLHYAYLYAEEGFRVVLPEADYHGEREKDLDELEMDFKFWDIVVNEIKEIQVIKDELIGEGLVDKTRIGIAGTSMGGIVTLGALTQYPWIKTAVSLMGSPYYEEFCRGQIEELKRHDIELPFSEAELEEKYAELRKYDLSIQPETLNGRPLFFWHGEKDKMVPFKYTHEFYQEIKPLYKGKEENLSFIADTRADHKVTREGLLASVEWFKKHL
ncbi:prolyl oligopeptidase family serine peptidase [Bacillus sp. REN16]|uniref:prolyl oligopeptidase family serine peptidase n=1 Tax=Bacillus sp. REN16 TaxID=2887296 RepID=UPI001E525009|nr:prolyl oligopeptidase family serine peptidase [Bacillus sp. REN16]MCC3355564.1 prolyl oligopeptidase family serine peptidase [Bacillus sp. REN16]